MKIRLAEGGRKSFWCPACKEPHTVNDSWGWNANTENPTLTPSVRVFTNNGPGTPDRTLCHSQITYGRIYFYPDSPHLLRGMTVGLPDWPKDW